MRFFTFWRLRTTIQLVGPLCLILFLGGCALTDTNDRAVEIAFATTSERYDVVADPSSPSRLLFEIVSTLRNKGSDRIRLTGCQVPNRPLLQKNVAGSWTTVYSVAEPECFSPPFVLREDETHSDTLFVDTKLDPDKSTGANWESGIPVDGTYRLIRLIYGSTESLVLLDEVDRVSAPFEIHVSFE